MRRCVSVMLAAVLILTGCSAKIVQNGPKPVDNTVYTRESAGVRLQDDFYGYMNFDLLYGSDIPADTNEWSAGQLVNRQVDEILSDEIIAIVRGGGYPDGSDEQKIHDLYEQYLDDEARERTGLVPLEKVFSTVEEARSAAEFVRACGMLYTDYGVAVLPAVYVSQDHFDSSRYCVSIGQMELFYSTDELLNGKDSAEQLQQHITELLKAFGTENADSLAYDTVTMLLDIAGSTADLGSMTVEETHNVRKPAELDTLIAEYIETLGSGGRDVIVYDNEQLDKVCTLLTDENLPYWKALAECVLFNSYREYLPQSCTEFFSRDKTSYEEKALNAVKKLLSGEVGNIYAKKHLDEKTLSAARQMTEDIIAAYRNVIKTSDILSEIERAECLAKTEHISVNIGCPDEDNHSSSEVSGSLLESVISIKSAAVRAALSKIDETPEPTDWYMLPQTVNALCRPQSNSITIPMAMFTAPYFDVNADYYTNLGGLGSVIAHEIGHDFDAEGILYDEYGNYRPERKGSERTKLLSDEVSSYFGSRQIMGTFSIDGERTMGENAADLGGMQVIASMTDDKEELKRIFESYANIWATLSFDTDVAEHIADDVHSPAEIRVNAVLSSVDKFYEVYGITETDGMYLSTEKRVRVW